MSQIAFLLGDTAQARHDNHVRIPRAFERAGWQVTTLPQECIRLEPSGVRLGSADPQHFALMWVMGLGRAPSFLDRMQLLRLLPQHQFVTDVDALTYCHAKYAWWRHMPETYASNDAAVLWAKLVEGGDWVAKPPAGSYGRDVVRVRPDDDGRAVLERLTGDDGHYCLLQRFVPEIERGEKRTLVAGGCIIGSYLRVPADLRANLAAGGTPHPATLTPAERHLVDTLASSLATQGVGFAAVDTVFPYLMEVNLANPGGLATLEHLYGHDADAEAVAAIARWSGARRRGAQ